MDIDLIKIITGLQQQTDEAIKPEEAIIAIDPFLKLPGLIGFWPLSSVQRSTGNAYDLSGQGRTLTYNGNPVYSINNDIIPFIDLDGTGDYLDRADETDLDVTGTETIYASTVRGLTVGGWFRFDDIGVARMCMAKRGGGGNISWSINRTAADIIRLAISSDGAATHTVDSSAVVADQWYFIVGSFQPGLATSITVNNITSTNSVAVPASIFNSTANLEIGSFNGGIQLLDGKVSLCFLSANFLDTTISSLFEQTRSAFGV